MVLNLEKLNNLIKKKKVEISMHTIVAHCDLERQSHNLILKKAKQIKKFKDLSSLDLTDFDVSIQINNNMISIFATNENKESISIIFLHQKHKDLTFQDVLDVLNWEVSNPKLFATLLYHSFQEIIVNSDGTFENINTAIWKEAESGKFYFHCVRDMHSFENYDTLEDAFEALKANFVIKEI